MKRSDDIDGLPKPARALLFAVEKHSGQLRKYNGLPYIMHPIRVAERVRLHFSGRPQAEDAVAAAYLHDVVEDSGVSVEEIVELFGPVVANFVRELSNPSKGSKLPRAERKKMDREHISKISSVAKVIKLFDRIDNLSEMEGSEDDFKFLYAEESLKLLEVLRGVNEVLEGVLEEKVLALRGVKSGESK